MLEKRHVLVSRIGRDQLGGLEQPPAVLPACTPGLYGGSSPSPVVGEVRAVPSFRDQPTVSESRAEVAR
ncbi:hypothetical protein SY2F82_34040 [Streptomyces sp. Y2F8-2]|nr:hypothetical protein SY2F82_34040 [Streptomyces sp. Y2F8-2]